MRVSIAFSDDVKQTCLLADHERKHYLTLFRTEGKMEEFKTARRCPRATTLYLRAHILLYISINNVYSDITGALGNNIVHFNKAASKAPTLRQIVRWALRSFFPRDAVVIVVRGSKLFSYHTPGFFCAHALLPASGMRCDLPAGLWRSNEGFSVCTAEPRV